MVRTESLGQDKRTGRLGGALLSRGLCGHLPSLTSSAPRTSGIWRRVRVCPLPTPAFGQDPGKCMSEAVIVAGA